MRKALVIALGLLATCSQGGPGGSDGGFRLIEFLEAGRNNIPRKQDD